VYFSLEVCTIVAVNREPSPKAREEKFCGLQDFPVLPSNEFH
jgi:hypothetical protein